MSFEAFAWILTPLVPALVALYFLKLKRREVVVSSTFLWRKSLEDLHVNSPFQRLRRSILLLLQLLILLGLISAASRPVVSTIQEEARTRILLIDNSASMNVKEEGGTRLELALAQARDLVAGMEQGERASVIAFSLRAVLVQSLTNDTARLTAALNSIRATSYPTDFLSAVRTAGSIASSAQDAEIYVFSDGCFGELSNVAPELERLKLRFVSVGTDRSNLGLTELDVRRDFGRAQTAEVFAAVLNSGSEPATVALNVRDGDRIVDAAMLEIPAGKTATHVFDGSAHADKVLRIELESNDAFDDDDRGWVRIDPPSPIEILMVGRDWFIEKFFGIRPHFHVRLIALATYESMAADGRLETDPADLVIFVGQAPSGAPDRAAMYLGCYPRLPELLVPEPEDDAEPRPAPTEEELAALRLERVENPTIIDWDRVHPVTTITNFADLLIVESVRFAESSGFHSLIDSDEGSIAGTLVLTPSGRPAVSVLLLGFDVKSTNWPWLPSFPMFFHDAITWLGAAAAGDAAERYRTGEVIVDHLPPDTEGTVVVRGPDGEDRETEPSRTGELAFAHTSVPGVYELSVDGEVLRRYPVSLLSHAESHIKPTTEIQLGSGGVAQSEEVPETTDLWKWFAALALAIVLLEWWVFNKRLTV